jgi:ribonuclease T2
VAALLLAASAAGAAFADGIAGQFDFYVLSMSWSARPCGRDIAMNQPVLCREGGHGFDFAGLAPRHEVGAPTSCPTFFTLHARRRRLGWPA